MSSIARRYARAIFALAQEEGTLDRTGAELDILADAVRDPETAAGLASPLLSPANRRAIVDAVCERLALQPTTRKFLALLAERQRLGLLVGIGEQFRRILDQSLGRVRARITAAAALSAEQEAQVLQTFARLTGKTVLAESRVDPGLLGGLVVEVEGTVYDGSVQTQLQHLAGLIAGGATHV